MVEVTFHENELENWESELGISGGCSSCTDTPKKQLLCDFRGKWSDTTHGAFQQLKKVVVAPLTGDRSRAAAEECCGLGFSKRFRNRFWHCYGHRFFVF